MDTRDKEYRRQAQAKALEVAREHPNLTIKVVGCWVWVWGDGTREARDGLKALDLRWAPKKEKWYWRGRPSGRGKPVPYMRIITRYGEDDIAEIVPAG